MPLRTGAAVQRIQTPIGCPCGQRVIRLREDNAWAILLDLRLQFPYCYSIILSSSSSISSSVSLLRQWPPPSKNTIVGCSFSCAATFTSSSLILSSIACLISSSVIVIPASEAMMMACWSIVCDAEMVRYCSIPLAVWLKAACPSETSPATRSYPTVPGCPS